MYRVARGRIHTIRDTFNFKTDYCGLRENVPLPYCFTAVMYFLVDERKLMTHGDNEYQVQQ